MAILVVALVGSMTASASASASVFFVATLANGGNDANTCTTAEPVPDDRRRDNARGGRAGCGDYQRRCGQLHRGRRPRQRDRLGHVDRRRRQRCRGYDDPGVLGNPTVNLGNSSSGNTLSHLHILNPPATPTMEWTSATLDAHRRGDRHAGRRRRRRLDRNRLLARDVQRRQRDDGRLHERRRHPEQRAGADPERRHRRSERRRPRHLGEWVADARQRWRHDGQRREQPAGDRGR